MAHRTPEDLERWALGYVYRNNSKNHSAPPVVQGVGASTPPFQMVVWKLPPLVSTPETYCLPWQLCWQNRSLPAMAVSLHSSPLNLTLQSASDHWNYVHMQRLGSGSLCR